MSADYFNSHLAHFVVSLGPGDFWQLHLDTVLVSVLVALMILGSISWILRQVNPDKASYGQVALESFYDLISRETVAGTGQNNLTVNALVFSTFAWIVGMNLLDLLPINAVNFIYSTYTQQENALYSFKIVPTADLNMDLALATVVASSLVYFSITRKGGLGYIKYWFSQPFGILAFPANIVLNLIEDVVQPLALGLRLFFNMFAGEILTLVISGSPFFFRILLGTSWSMFHGVLVLFQAYIFMSLMLAYINHAQSH